MAVEAPRHGKLPLPRHSLLMCWALDQDEPVVAPPWYPEGTPFAIVQFPPLSKLPDFQLHYNSTVPALWMLVAVAAALNQSHPAVGAYALVCEYMRVQEPFNSTAALPETNIPNTDAEQAVEVLLRNPLPDSAFKLKALSGSKRSA